MSDPVLSFMTVLATSGIPGLQELGLGFLVGYYGARAASSRNTPPIQVSDPGANQAIAKLALSVNALYNLLSLVMALYVYPAARQTVLLGARQEAFDNAVEARLRWIIYGYVPGQIRWVHDTITREVVSGYTERWHDRLSLAGRIADDIGARNPVVKDAIGLLVRYATDLAEADNPVLRFALQRVITYALGRLGVDRAAGDLLAGLLGPVLDHHKPKNLHDTARDIDQRLDVIEQEWATFMADGGPEILQAGRDWKELTSPAADAAILAFFGLAVTHPDQFARDVSDTIGVAANEAVKGVIDLLRGV